MRGDAYEHLARDYPGVVLVIGAVFTACSAIAHAVRRRRTRRILAAFDGDRLRDVGFTYADLDNGRLDHVLKTQHAAARPEGSWARAWSWLLTADRGRKALAALGEDQLCNLSERGLQARREARHDHRSACTCRTSGARR